MLRNDRRTPVLPEHVLAALPRDVALVDLLEYTHSSPAPEGRRKLKTERRLVAFVLRPGLSIARVELGAAQPIDAAVRRWLDEIARRSRGDGPDAPATELRRRVWEPLERHLDQAKTVLVSPDGTLSRLPWAALPGKVPGTCLIAQQAFVITPVPRLLHQRLTDPRRPERLHWDPDKPMHYVKE